MDLWFPPTESKASRAIDMKWKQIDEKRGQNCFAKSNQRKSNSTNNKRDFIHVLKLCLNDDRL